TARQSEPPDSPPDLLSTVPSPARGVMQIRYRLRHGEPSVTLIINDASGKEVLRLLNAKRQEAGEQSVTLDTRNMPAGTYFYTIQTGHHSAVAGFQIVR